MLLGTLLVALAGGADSMAAVAAFTHDYRAWFRLWLPPGRHHPVVRRLDPETAMQAALWLLDGTGLPGLKELILAREPCDAKSNEITAIPRLLDHIHLQGAIVQALRAADADQGIFTPWAGDRRETVERNGGRRKQRRCTVLGDPGL